MGCLTQDSGFLADNTHWRKVAIHLAEWNIPIINHVCLKGCNCSGDVCWKCSHFSLFSNTCHMLDCYNFVAF